MYIFLLYKCKAPFTTLRYTCTSPKRENDMNLYSILKRGSLKEFEQIK